MTRNSEALRSIGDRIVSDPSSYDQASWTSTCGTTMCIAGYGCMEMPGFVGFKVVRGVHLAIFDESSGLPPHFLHPSSSAVRAFLKLTEDDADALFDALWKPVGWDEYTPDEKLPLLVRDALYALASGASVEEVTAEELL